MTDRRSLSTIGPEGWQVVLGPPGCGKTNRLMELVQAELAHGTPVGEIAYTSFTKAACGEAIARARMLAGLGDDDLPWFRTIHSTAFRLLGLSREQVMGRARWAEFAQWAGYRLTGFEAEAEDGRPGLVDVPRRTADDDLRFLQQWGGNRRLDDDTVLAQCRIRVNAVAFRQYVAHVRAFKAARGVLDFNDMLEAVLERGLRPPVRVALVDEAQDLSPLQIAVVEQWFGACERVTIAGDDDQAVYTFQGADPDWLLRLSREHPTETLRQSYRVPGAVHALASAIIKRNTRRVAKPHRPTEQAGRVEGMALRPAVDLLDESANAFVLVRNRMFIRPFVAALLDRCLPFLVEGGGGISPMGARSSLGAVRAALAVYQKVPVDARDLADLLALIPSYGPGLLARGVKTRVSELNGALDERVLVDLGLDSLLAKVRDEGPTSVLLRMAPVHRRYFEGLLKRYGEVPEPRVRLMTVHGSKGRESDLVLVVPDMTKAAYDQYQAAGDGAELERRVAYVAVTRARERLVILEPATRRFFDYPLAAMGPVPVRPTEPGEP